MDNDPHEVTAVQANKTGLLHRANSQWKYFSLGTNLNMYFI